ncbi:(2Fe-2S)-binding protein [Chelatococcus asaccharovorans]|uniref:(2Fe-2S)-binding protein n=1 Tax=Chelatococcus asaccharovorans TaxID=28210 RepID=UPI00224C7556|nr:(2Fe-2S)-binding protein [Chelatococcus asaccharovorans]CAH1653055.1 2Fe-2S iron-sulfur cluster protein [Chelatococcus asaccharovorans]CAH1693892.1 2Fe-2S iron-sulfur cluster protein [Chelatococcus asaccharovorans]
MFRRIDGGDNGTAGALSFDGQAIPFRAGDTVAAALLAAGVADVRDNPVDGSRRAPYCMMGVCFECLVEIDGRQNQQACLVTAKPGMRIRRQAGARLLPEGAL